MEIEEGTRDLAIRMSALQLAVEAIEFETEVSSTTALAEDFYKFLTPDKDTRQGELFDLKAFNKKPD